MIPTPFSAVNILVIAECNTVVTRVWGPLEPRETQHQRKPKCGHPTVLYTSLCRRESGYNIKVKCLPACPAGEWKPGEVLSSEILVFVQNSFLNFSRQGNYTSHWQKVWSCDLLWPIKHKGNWYVLIWLNIWRCFPTSPFPLSRVHLSWIEAAPWSWNEQVRSRDAPYL